MDALSEVLGHVRLKDAGWACILAGTPWGFSLEATKGCVRFHYVTRGSCWLSAEGVAQPRVALSGGDLAVLPHGHATPSGSSRGAASPRSRTRSSGRPPSRGGRTIT